MYSHSRKTVRASSIPNDSSKEHWVNQVEILCASRPDRFTWNIFRTLPRPSVEIHHPIVSLARQSGTQTATITFPSRELKTSALDIHGDWNLDDTFSGITVLHSDPEPILDIVSVHGLGGNAFDTFAWDAERMWLRDFLPFHPQLCKTRTMTFGYSSNPQDSRNNEGVREWASALLREVVSVRESPTERSRPIIFVCHSLGGLVAREAMIMLGRDPQSYEGLDVKHCGILFLATPHSGSNLADWDDIFVQLAQLAGIRGTAVKNTLKSFNSGGMIAKEDFGRLSPIPPYECLYETRKMMIGMRRRIVVEADSAGLDAVKAQPMADVDHRQICRFKHDTSPGYKQVIACLKRIRDRIMSANAPGDLHNPLQTQRQPGGDENSDTGLMPLQQDVNSTVHVSQVPTFSGIQSGEGTGGDIRMSDNGLFMGGGRATGAKMSLQHLKDFKGRVEGGIGLGSTIQ